LALLVEQGLEIVRLERGVVKVGTVDRHSGSRRFLSVFIVAEQSCF
jgi:hypothetical protein